MKIFVLGANGMLGTYVYEYLKDKYDDVKSITRDKMDASSASILSLLAMGIMPEDVVINCVGLIPQRGSKDKLESIRVNSVFPLVIADVCNAVDAHFIHITTDCVFFGATGDYNERAEHDAQDIYGRTKSLGEPHNATVIRTSIIGEERRNKLSLLEWVKSQKGGEVNGFINHHWNGITCLQFAKICEHIIDNNLFWRGVKHVMSPSAKTKMELIQMISDIYDLDIKVNPFVSPNKCDRTMSSSRKDIEIEVPELEDQVREMREFYNR